MRRTSRDRCVGHALTLCDRRYHDHVDDSVFTNVGAAFTLNITIAWARLLGVSVPPTYAQVAAGLRVLYDAALGVHLEFAGYAGAKIKQADVILLGFPMRKWQRVLLAVLLLAHVLAAMDIDAATRARNVLYYTNRTDMDGPAMTWGATSIALLEQGLDQLGLAQGYFEQSYKLYRHAPFGIWFETTTGGKSAFTRSAIVSSSLTHAPTQARRTLSRGLEGFCKRCRLAGLDCAST